MESPKGDASEGILNQLEQKASAEVATITASVGMVGAAQAQQAGGLEEAHKAETGSGVTADSTTGKLGLDIVADSLGLGGVSAAIEGLAERVESKSHDVTKAQKSLGGIVSGQVTSFDEMLKPRKIDSLKRGASLSEKMNISAKSLAGQGDSVQSWKIKGDGLQNTKTFAVALQKNNENVLSNIRSLRAQQGPARAQMAPGGAVPKLQQNRDFKPGAGLGKEPEVTDTTTDWA